MRLIKKYDPVDVYPHYRCLRNDKYKHEYQDCYFTGVSFRQIMKLGNTWKAKGKFPFCSSQGLNSTSFCCISQQWEIQVFPRGLAVVLISTTSSACRGAEDAGREDVSLSKSP